MNKNDTFGHNFDDFGYKKYKILKFWMMSKIVFLGHVGFGNE